jgi:hypothetical protein
MMGFTVRKGILETTGYMVAVLAAVLACSTSGSGDKDSSKSSKTANVGDTVTFSDSEWVVSKVEDKGKALKCALDEKKTEGKFVWVEFKVKNTSKKEETIFDHPKLKDSEGREFGSYQEQTLCVGDKKTMIAEQLPPSMQKEFVAIYEVPGDAKELTFNARELGFGGDTTAVKLGF